LIFVGAGKASGQFRPGRPEWDLSYDSNLTPRRLSYGSNSTPHHLSYSSNGVAQLSRERKAHDGKVIVVATAFLPPRNPSIRN
jgi:hypothetical protein